MLSFDNTDGAYLYGGLMQGTDGTLYGTTPYGGNLSDCNGLGCGTVFSLSMGLGPFITTLPSSGKIGTAVKILGTDLKGASSVTFNGTAATFKVMSGSLSQPAFRWEPRWAR